MKKKWMIGLIIALVCTTVFGACKRPGGSDDEKETASETVKSADEVIKDAEKSSYLSGDADEGSLYDAGELLFGSVVPAFMQRHTRDEFPEFDGDDDYFTPVSDDYLIASFEKDKTAIYEFMDDGSLLAVRGRIVYDSAETLLRENAGKALEEDKYDENGYTYRGNVLYYVMRKDALFAAGYRIDKYKLLSTAASGAWDGDLFWFSKPYEDPLSAFDKEKWDEVLTVAEALIPDPERAKIDETDPSGKNPLSEETVRELFTELMKKNGKTPEEYENSEYKLVMNEDGYAFASLLFYTVPADYVPGGKIENFLISAALSFDEDEETWAVADQNAFFQDKKTEYYEAVLTDGAYEAFQSGAFVKRLWVPFQPGDPVLLKDAVVGKVTEVYEADGGELAVTLFFSNETGKDVRIATLDSLVLTCQTGTIADVGAELGIDLNAGTFMYETVLIPPEYLSVSSFSDAAVSAFAFSVEE